VAQGKTTKRETLANYLAEAKPGVVDLAVQAEIARRLAPVSASYLRKLLREASVPLHPLVEGVRQDTFEDLERTLLNLLACYEEAHRHNHRPGMRQCRDAVIEAKSHARLAMRRADAGKRSEKEEMVSWMLVWLENPAVFPAWVSLRKRALTESRPTPPG
jgi:hypothetical protein